MTPRPVAVDRVLAPFREFAATSASSGLLLMAAAVVALIWANSPLADSYQELWSTPVSIRVGAFVFEETLLHWVNDGLMVIFFLVVGLEIRREFVAGELASRRRATLPIAAAIGGAVLPALIFLLVVRDPGGQRGWGVPMATDIAFALAFSRCWARARPLGCGSSSRPWRSSTTC